MTLRAYHSIWPVRRLDVPRSMHLDLSEFCTSKIGTAKVQLASSAESRHSRPDQNTAPHYTTLQHIHLCRLLGRTATWTKCIIGSRVRATVFDQKWQQITLTTSSEEYLRYLKVPYLRVRQASTVPRAYQLRYLPRNGILIFCTAGMTCLTCQIAPPLPCSGCPRDDLPEIHD